MSCGPVFPVGENNPGTIWQHGWFNWLAVGTQHCHIISNSHKTEFSYLQNILLLSSRPDCFHFLKKGNFEKTQKNNRMWKSNNLKRSCWSAKRRKPSCSGTILHLHWNTRQQLPWSCLHSKERHSSTFKDSVHRKQNDDISHFHAQQHALQHTAMLPLQYPFIFLYLCFSTSFLPQALLWALYFLVFNLELIFFSEQILLSCFSSEPSLLYIRWEEVIQLSPKLYFKSLQAWLHR